MNLRVFSTGAFLVMGSVSIVIAGPPADPSYSFCQSPIATCDRPRPSSAVEQIRRGECYPDSPGGGVRYGGFRLPEIKGNHSIDVPTPGSPEPKRRRSTGPQPVPHKSIHEVRAVLDLWQAATEATVPVTDAQRLRLARNRPNLTGRQRTIVSELRGPIDADALRRRYDWTLREQGRSRSLIAVPKEALDRLFCGRIAIKLGDHNRPHSLTFTDAAGHSPRAIAMHKSSQPTRKVVTAFYTPTSTESKITPATATDPATPEAAPAMEEAPQLQRIKSRLTLPPAPTDNFLPQAN